MSNPQQTPQKRTTRASARSTTTHTPSAPSTSHLPPALQSNTPSNPLSSNAPPPAPSTAIDTWPRGTPMPIDWPPFPACTWYTSAELTLIVKIARGQDAMGWKCEDCGRRCGGSEVLLRHIVRSLGCGGTLTFVKLSAAQVLTLLAAVDYEHVSDNVCCYVYEWENNQLENTYSDPEPIPTLHPPFKNSTHPNPLLNLNAASTRPTKRGRPFKKLTPSIPQSSTAGPANFYNADKHEYIHLDIDPDIDALDDIVYGNIFPLVPPAFLSERDGREYGKRIGRLQKYSAHRIHYVKPGSIQVSGTEQLLADWMAQRAEGEEGRHGSYESWLSACVS